MKLRSSAPVVEGVLLALGALALVARIPMVAEPLGIDQGIFAYIGSQLNRGATLYRDAWDQKPPGIHLTYALAFRLFGDRPSSVALADLAAAIATACFVYLAAGRLWRDRLVAATAVVVYTVFTMPALRYNYGGFLERSVPETFIALLASLAAGLLLADVPRFGRRRAFGFGLAVGAACVFKYTASVYFVALGAAGWWRRSVLSPQSASVSPASSVVSSASTVVSCASSGTSREPSSVLRPQASVQLVVAAIAGLALPMVIVVLWLGARGALADLWYATVVYNRPYVAASYAGWGGLVSSAVHEFWRHTKTEFLWGAAAAAFLITGIRFLARGARAQDAGSDFVVMVWLVAASMAVVANGGRFFNTYFIQTLPPASLLAARLLTQAARLDVQLLPRSPSARALVRAGLVALVVLICARRENLLRAASATRTDMLRLLGRLPETMYEERFGGYNNGAGYSARANAELAAYVRARTAPNETIYIFGFEPGVYYAADRRAASRFVWIGPVIAGYLRDVPGFSPAALVGEIERARARYFIVERNNRDSAAGWEAASFAATDPDVSQELHTRYRLETTVEDFLVYARVTP